jgi:F-type H+-transporting ATPase subunit delta
VAVAHRMYARALLEAAKEQGRLGEVREQLGDFVASVRDVPELRELLRNPQVDPGAKVSILESLLGDADELVRNFLLLLAQRGRAAELEEIEREFERLVAEEEGRIEVELTTAVELSEEDAKSIVSQIEQAAGRTVEARRNVDPSLLGGIVLQAGSLRVDASVRGRLERLRRELVRRS